MKKTTNKKPVTSSNPKQKKKGATRRAPAVAKAPKTAALKAPSKKKPAAPAGGAPKVKPWTPENAVAAFTAALSRAGCDPVFRERLKKSVESAQAAVAEEGTIDVPANKVMIFHEDEYNEDYHAFYLPPLDLADPTKVHTYATHFQCCYNSW